MKKTAFLIILSALLLCSCAKEEYHPMIIVPSGYKLSGNVISARLSNVYFFDPYEEIICGDGGEMFLFSDDSYTTRFEGGTIELLDGMNTFFLVFSKDGLDAAYRLDIFCTMILDFNVEISEDKTYSIGDDFDRATVRVTATKENGDSVEITDYDAEYDFDTAGTRRVDIKYGGIVHSIYVNVG